jgi:hypothetical protein
LSAKPAGEGVPTWSILSVFCPKKTDETNTDSFVAEKEEKPSVREPASKYNYSLTNDNY